MPPLSSVAVSFYREVADEQVGNFGERLGVTLREHCANPEIAGGSVADFLNTLPRCTQTGPATPTIDGFIAEKMLKETRAVLLAIIDEGKHMEDMLGEVHHEGVDFSPSEDHDPPALRRLERYMERMANEEQNDAERSIREGARERDALVSASFQEGFHLRGEGDLKFSDLSPAVCYQNATRALIEGILHAGTGGDAARLPRLQPLIDGHVLSLTEAESIVQQIGILAAQLKFDSTGFTETMDV